ncbi:hypothetical protein ACEPPN_015231 [Leptodophora sp. 'Broadleaf-Isolate-01']
MSEKLSETITPSEMCDESANSEDTSAIEASIRRKFDLRIMPIVTFIFLFAFIDRSNTGNARLLGMAKDLQLTGFRFNIVLSAFYTTYILLEVPSNMMCKKFGPKIWLSFLGAGFGIVAMLTSTVSSFEGLVATRVVLGMLEAGVMPGIVFSLSCFYRRHELGARVGFYASVAPLSGAFGGLLATGLSRIPPWGIIHTWRNIFFFEGMMTFVVGVSAFFLIPRSPGTASFLAPDERLVAASRIASELQCVNPEKFEFRHFKRAVCSINTNLMAVACCCTLITMTSMSLFLPTILNTMGFTAIRSQLMSVPPYAWSTVVCLCISQVSDRTKSRGLWLLLCMPFTFVGFLLLITVQNVAVRYFATFLCLTGAFTVSPLLVAWTVDNSAGHTVRAIASAYVVSIANLGGLIATWTYLLPDAPKYIKGHWINLGAAILCCSLLAIATVYLRWENRQRALGKRAWRLEGLSEDEQNSLGHSHPDFRFTP